jgi:hypothetical protein
MKNLEEMLKKEDYDRVWEKYCGFLDLNLNEFMVIQERLLMEQIELLSRCELGQRIMGKGVKPTTSQEFRDIVPLTADEDYAGGLVIKMGMAVPARAVYWVGSSW